MLCLWLTSLSLNSFVSFTLSEVYAGDASSFSSALHFYTIIYTNTHYTASILLALTIPLLLYLSPPFTLFIYPPPPHTHTQILSSYIKMINVYLFFHSHYMCNDSDFYIDTRWYILS